MKIIDFHTHAFPDAIAERAVAKLKQGVTDSGVTGFDDKAYTDGTLDGLMAHMDGAGVEKAVLLPVATKSGQSDGINRWAAEYAVKTDRLIPFGAVFPDDTAAEQLERLAAAGYKGIKLHGDQQGFYADEPRMIDIYRRCGELGLIAVMHSGFDFASTHDMHVTPERMANVLDRVDGVRFVMAHMGGVLCEDRAVKCLAGAENVMFDTAYTAGRLSAEKMAELIDGFGYGNVLFATDSPWTDAAVQIRLVSDAVGDERKRLQILSGNAERLLGI